MRAILLVFFWAMGMSVAAFADTPGEVKVGEYLREATLHGFHKNTKKLSDYRGKPLLINVWASWCTPCREEMDSLNRLARRYNGKQFNVIGISTDDYVDAAELFVRKSKFSFTNYLDSKVFLENMLGANTIPTTVLVDANGKVLAKVHGAQEWDSPELVDAIGQTFNIKLRR
jgi:thiol-disulfide isomerase/thioredoxin